MNAFYEHHQDSIKFRYGCFDRILLNRASSRFWMEPEPKDSSGSIEKLTP
jgi:hypothetical protein